MNEQISHLQLRICQNVNHAHLAHGDDEGEQEGDEHEVEEAGGAVRGAKSGDEIRGETVGGISTAAAREEVGGGVEEVAAGSAAACVRLVGGRVAHWGEGGRAGAELQKVKADLFLHLCPSVLSTFSAIKV